MKHSKSIIFAFLFVGVALMGWEVKKYLDFREKNKLVLVVPRTTYSISTIIASEKGFFSNYGLKVQIEYVETGKIALNYLKENKADFANVVETSIAFLGFDPFDIKVLCNIEKTHKLGLLGRSDKGISAVTDLQKKKVGVVAGSGAKIFLDRILDKNGLSIQDVEIVTMQPSELLSEIAVGKKVDAVVLWEPLMNKVESILGDKAVVFKDPVILAGYKNLIGNKRFIEKHKDIVIKLLKAYIDAELFIKTNKTESIKIVADVLHTDKKSVESSWSSVDFQVSLTRNLLDAVIAEAYWVILNQKDYKGKGLPDYSNYFAPEYLAEVYSARVNW